LTSKARVSVIIPTYNRPRFLGEAVCSVLSQTEPSLEIIVVDDGSSETCRERIDCLRSLDSRLSIFHFPQNRGTAAARNFGLSQARGDFVLFLDDDDLLQPEVIKSNLDCFFRLPESDIVCCRSRLCFSRNPDGTKGADQARGRTISLLPNIRLVDQLDGRRLERSPFSELLRFPPPIHSLLFRKRCFDTTLFPEDLHVGEDVTFMLRLARQGLRFKFNTETEVLVRQHGTNFANQPDHFSRTAVYLSKLQNSGLLEEEHDQWLCRAKLFLALARDGQVRCLRSLLLLFRSPARLARYALDYAGLQLKKDRYLRKTERPRPAPLEVATVAKPKLLYISPVTPAPSGRGIAMRAYHNLLALAAGHSVTLLIIPPGIRSRPPSSLLRPLCESVIHLPLRFPKDWLLLLKIAVFKFAPLFVSSVFKLPSEMISCSWGRRQRAAAALAAGRYNSIHVFRFYLYPYAFFLAASQARPTLQLDLDEIESSMRRSLADLLDKKGKVPAARKIRHEAEKYRLHEHRVLSRFDSIFVSSGVEADKVRDLCGCRNVKILPNVVGDGHPRQRRQGGPFVFLMVGIYSYYPNLDGVLDFCDRILPLVRSRSNQECVFRIVGPGLPRGQVSRLSSFPGVEVLGFVPDIGTAYAGADAAVVPLRVGGGTRIKVLEAMSFGVPVISTSIGVEGLSLRSGLEVLIGDTPEEFASQCLRLLHSPELRQLLSEASYRRVKSSYQLKAAQAVLE
jgi:glycosyltransferase involved in cell wall biosynthesis/GT2 family glycosyltransferase